MCLQRGAGDAEPGWRWAEPLARQVQPWPACHRHGEEPLGRDAEESQEADGHVAPTAHVAGSDRNGASSMSSGLATRCPGGMGPFTTGSSTMFVLLMFLSIISCFKNILGMCCTKSPALH